MTKKWLLGIAVAIIIWPALAHAEGRPATAADLSGKKICWNGGLEVTYQANGETLETRFGRFVRHSPWSVPEPGLVKFRLVHAPMVVLPDGSFHVQRFNGKSGGSLTSADLYYDSWGTVCN
jgi:hypothetical protein